MYRPVFMSFLLSEPNITNLSSGWVFGLVLRIAAALVGLPGNFLGEVAMPFLGLPLPPAIFAGLFQFFSTGFRILLQMIPQ